MPRTLRISMALALLVGFLPAWELPAAAADDAYEAVVSRVVPVAEWQRAGKARWQKAAPETVLYPGDTLRTGPQALVELRYGDGSVARVGSLTTFTLREGPRREIRLDAGKLWLQIRKGGAGMRVLTPGAVAAVTGTELMVEVDPAAKRTDVTVFEGAVDVTGDIGALVRVIGGTTTRVTDRLPAIAPAPLPALKVQERARLFTPLAAPVPPGAAPVPVQKPLPPAQTQHAEPTPAPEHHGASEPGAQEHAGGEQATTPDSGSQGEEHPAGPDAALPTPAPLGPTPGPAATPAPVAPTPAPTPAPVQPDLKGQNGALLDPRVIGGSTTTGGIKVIIE